MDGPKGGFYSELPVAKRRQQEGSSVMIRTGIANQMIIGPVKVDKEIKLNSANYCNFIDKTFFVWYKSSFAVSE